MARYPEGHMRTGQEADRVAVERKVSKRPPLANQKAPGRRQSLGVLRTAGG